jgi:hypothetical protein
MRRIQRFFTDFSFIKSLCFIGSIRVLLKNGTLMRRIQRFFTDFSFIKSLCFIGSIRSIRVLLKKWDTDETDSTVFH